MGENVGVTWFLSQNRDLPLQFDGLSVWFVNLGGKLHMFLEIGEDTGIAQVKEGWWRIGEWRDRLLRWQGPWTEPEWQIGYRLYLYSLAGVTPAKLAQQINTTVTYVLEQYRRDGSQFNLELIHKILKELNFSEEDIKSTIEGGLQNLAEGNPCFDRPREPVDSYIVRGWLKTWKRRMGGR